MAHMEVHENGPYGIPNEHPYTPLLGSALKSLFRDNGQQHGNLL